MQITNFVVKGVVFSLSLLAGQLLFDGQPIAQTQTATTETTPEAVSDQLTTEEMEVLVARIALYPDDLVAAIVSASLYPLQIVEAERFLEAKQKKKDLAPNKEWDGSVISLLNYPEIVKMMSDDLEWTQSLGAVAVDQQEDLLAAIQQLREKAVAMGVLKSNDKVVVEKASAESGSSAGGPPAQGGESIVIKSSDPQVVYVPQYPPEMLYEDNYPIPAEPIYYGDSYPSYWYPGAGFWAGAITGAIWGGAIDWGGDHIWGGDVDVDIDWDRGDINIGDVNVGKFDRNNLDMSKIDRNNFDFSKIDKSKLNFDKSKISRDQLGNDLKARDSNRLDNKRANRPEAGPLAGAGNRPQSQDVRKNIEQGLKKQGKTGAPGVGNKGSGNKGVGQGAGAGNRPQAAQRPSGGQQAKTKAGKGQGGGKKQAAGPRPGSRPDNRPKSPGAIGDYQRGSSTRAASDRARVSHSAPQYRGPSGGYGRGGGGGYHRPPGGGGRGGGGRRR